MSKDLFKKLGWSEDLIAAIEGMNLDFDVKFDYDDVFKSGSNVVETIDSTINSPVGLPVGYNHISLKSDD